MTAAAPKLVPQTPGVVAFVDSETREALRQAAFELGWSTLSFRGRALTDALIHVPRGDEADILVVDVSCCEDVADALDRLADHCEAHVRVIAVGAANDIRLYQQLIGMGVSEYLVKPADPGDLAKAMTRATEAEAASAGSGPVKRCRTSAFVGARGGVGATSLALSTAWAMAEECERRTALLDLDLQFGSVGLALDIELGRGLAEILARPERIDTLLIGSAGVQAGERLTVLGAEETLDGAAPGSADGLRALLPMLEEEADAVVIDVPRRLDGMCRAALAEVDAVVVVTDLTLPGMRDTRRLVQLLRDLRLAGEVLVVGNRAGGVGGELPRAEFERGAGVSLDFLVPNDPKAAAAAAEKAESMLEASRNGGGAPELRRLVRRLLGEAAAPQAPARASWLKTVLGR